MDLAGYRPTLGEVAGLFGKSSRWISDLRAKGEMPADGATLGEFIAAFGSLTAAQSGGARGKPIDSHKARLAAAKADQAEMETAQLRRELLPRTLVVPTVQAAFARVRAKMLAVPAKCAPQVASMKSAVTIQERLTELVHEALDELARTDVEVAGEPAASGSDDRAGGSGEGMVAGVHAAASTDREPVGGPEPDAQPRGKRRTRNVEHQPG